MASGPITSWQIEVEKVETVTDFIFLDSKITADSNCSHEIRKCLLLGRKAMTNLDSQRGPSVVRRGGAEALRSTAPPWLLVGLGTGQVPGKFD